MYGVGRIAWLVSLSWFRVCPTGSGTPYRAAGLLTPGGFVRIRAGGQGVRLLLLAGKPIGEPVVQYGPFVMNTPEEIQQAVIDYQRGQLAVAG